MSAGHAHARKKGIALRTQHSQVEIRVELSLKEDIFSPVITIEGWFDAYLPHLVDGHVE